MADSANVFPGMGISTGIAAGMGIHTAGLFNRTASEYRRLLQDYKKGLVAITLGYRLMQLDYQTNQLSSQSPLSSGVKKDIDSLPVLVGSKNGNSTITAEPTATTGENSPFSKFVEKYGSHYVSQENFGGMCEFRAIYDLQSTTSNMTRRQQWEQAVKQISDLALTPLSVPTDMSTALAAARHVKPSDHFKGKTGVTFKCVGGDTTILGSGGAVDGTGAGGAALAPAKGAFFKWAQTVYANPAPIPPSMGGIQLRPIDDLISQGVGAPSHATQQQQELAGKKRVMRLAVLNAMAVSKTTATKPVRDSVPVKLAKNDDGMSAAAAAAAAISIGTATASSSSDPVTNPYRTTSTSVQYGVPGVCDGTGSVGVGCGYDATEVELYGMTINPKKPVLALPPCKAQCYQYPPPAADPQCSYCVYSAPFSNTHYRVPSNVFVENTPVSGGCFQFEEFQTYEAYDKWGISKSGMKTKLVEKKLMRDDAASLAYKYLIWHSVQLVDMGAAPSYDFKTATTALPLQLAGNEATYMEFVKDFGTHVMTQTYMGGLALVTTFFHECFYNYFSVETLVEIIEHHFGLL
jgi:hypothetical protein